MSASVATRISTSPFRNRSSSTLFASGVRLACIMATLSRSVSPTISRRWWAAACVSATVFTNTMARVGAKVAAPLHHAVCFVDYKRANMLREFGLAEQAAHLAILEGHLWRGQNHLMFPFSQRLSAPPSLLNVSPLTTAADMFIFSKRDACTLIQYLKTQFRA